MTICNWVGDKIKFFLHMAGPGWQGSLQQGARMNLGRGGWGGEANDSPLKKPGNRGNNFDYTTCIYNLSWTLKLSDVHVHVHCTCRNHDPNLDLLYPSYFHYGDFNGKPEA